MKLKALSCVAAVCLSVSTGFSATYNLYSQPSTSSKVVEKIDTTKSDMQNYVRFFDSKDGKWAKYANTKNGKVGWISLSQVEKKKENTLRDHLVKNIDENIKYHKSQITSLEKLKTKIDTANYKELKQYVFGDNESGFVKYSSSWIGKDGKIHNKSKTYEF